MTESAIQFHTHLLEANPPEEDIQRQLHTDVEITKLTITGRDFIKTHFVNNRFDIDGVFCQQYSISSTTATVVATVDAVDEDVDAATVCVDVVISL